MRCCKCHTWEKACTAQCTFPYESTQRVREDSKSRDLRAEFQRPHLGFAERGDTSTVTCSVFAVSDTGETGMRTVAMREWLWAKDFRAHVALVTQAPQVAPRFRTSFSKMANNSPPSAGGFLLF